MKNQIAINKRVLAIEDEPLNQELYTAIAEDFGFAVIIAEDAKQGLQFIKEANELSQPFDLIFMDVHLPGMNGIDATKIIRETMKDVPIIGVSANALKEQQYSALLAGMDAYLTKPIEFEKLMVILKTYIGVEL